MHIYLISGKARHGKDTTADIIIKETQGTKISLAKTIKQYAVDYFGWDGKEETKPREFLQILGTEVIREKLNDPDFHVRRTCEDISVISEYKKIMGENAPIFIVPDCRYVNEIEGFIDCFGEQNVTSIRVDRPDFDNGLTEEQKNHKSEISLDNYQNFNYSISNTSLDELKESVLDILNK